MREWKTIDKSEWERGQWDNEPDKVQWVDEATGLDCLIVRNHGGAWCGYVGLPEGHPYYEVGYSDCTQKPPCGESYCDHSPDVDVHGGLTFADHCHEPSREAWEKWRVWLRAAAPEAVTHPKGDTARAFKETGHLLDDYDGWRTYREGRGICHLPQPGQPDEVWWLGFDCAHSGDKSDMAYSAEMRSRFRFGEDYYKDIGYVRREVASLAKQLKAVGTK